MVLLKSLFLYFIKNSGNNMKNRLILLASTFFLLNTLLCFSEARFMKYPDLNGDKIVFTYEGDLWLANAQGGQSVRITSHPGEESSAKFSPDGKWIAFTGDYDGNNNAYLIPASGGKPKRLTWNDGCQVLNWTRDGKNIVFRNARESDYRGITRLWSVSPEGEMPSALPVPKGILCSFSPDGKKMAYNPRGREEYYWKRYKGGQFIELWLYDYETNQYSKLTDYVGKNAYPMWIGEFLYFASDRGENGITNIYKYDFAIKKIEQVTFHKDFDVQMPSTDGKKIIYMNAGYIYILDPKDNSSNKITVDAPNDDWKLADRTINPTDYIHSFNVSNDGKTAVFDARGDVFSASVKDNGEQPKNLTNTNDSRERYSDISPDGKWIAFFSDKTGDYELYIKSTENEKAEWTKLTNGLGRTSYHTVWSPDSKKLLFSTKDFNLYYIDINEKALVLVDTSRQLKNDEFYWEVSDYCWSPDSKWISYSFVQFNRNNQIFLYSLESAKKQAVTSDFYDCMNPSFDVNGDMLYFLSYQDYSVRMDIFEDNHIINHPVQVMAIQLRAGEKPPFVSDDTVSKESKPFRIDLENISSRIFKAPIPSGNYFYLKAGKGRVTYASVDGYEGGEYRGVFTPRAGEKWTLNIFSAKDKKVFSIPDKISDWRISSNGEQVIIKKSSDYYVKKLNDFDSSRGLKDKINLSKMFYTIDVKKEWAQIFNDTWRWYRDFFYDPDFHGKDWKALGDKFKACIPDLRSRQDLNWLMSQMVGELCVSHTYVGGGDFSPQQSVRGQVYTGYLGCDLVPDKSGYYRIEKILGPTEFSQNSRGPLSKQDIKVKDGDLLLAINGFEIKYPENIYKHLQVTPGEKVSITVSSSAGGKGETYEVEPVGSEYGLRYDRWISDNINTIKKNSNDEVGYMHLTAMGDQNTGQFDKYWRAFRYKKGLIIDVRGNGGGWTEYFMIDKLERQMVAYNCVKGMENFRYPGSVTTGKLIVISNEYNGSDGEAFIEHFKARKLGTVIGVPSWGGLVGILNSQTTIDNGNVEQSNNGFYNKEGKWLVENHGADPDIYIDNDPESLMQGRDMQLEKAIETAKEQIKADPFTFPSKPAIPKR